MVRVLLRNFLLLALLVSAQGAEVRARRTVLSGVEQATTLFVEVGEHQVPTKEHPRSYRLHSVPPPNGRAPADWFVKWVGIYLADKGYIETSGATPLHLVCHWGDVDPQISHVGRPLQQVEIAGRTILDPRISRNFRVYLSKTVPTCIISAFDTTANGATPSAPKLVWQTKLWLVLYAVPTAGQVKIGPLVVKEGDVQDRPRSGGGEGDTAAPPRQAPGTP